MSGSKKDRMSPWLIGALLLAVGVAAYMLIQPLLRPSVSLSVGDGVYKTRVAHTNEQREKGLSGVDYMSETDAMLFVFDHSDKWVMWMNDMKIPLDIIWLDEDQKVVYIVKGASPDDFPTPYVPNDPALYVLELPAGAVDAKKIKIGTKAIFSRDEIRRMK